MTIHPLTLLPVVALATAAATLYLAAARRGRTPWPPGRTAAGLAGIAAIAAGVAAATLPGHDPRLHMAGHLLAGMAGPLLVALSAPMTLALRTLRPPARRRLTALLGSAPARVLGHPFTALALTAGGLYALYLTPLHAEAMHDMRIGVLVQVHVVAAGTLFAWAVVGVDHVPRRPSLRVRGAALLAAIALHTVLSRILLADADRLAAEAGGTLSAWVTATELMWFEGDLIELAMLVVFARQAVRAGRSRTGSPAPGTGAAGAAR